MGSISLNSVGVTAVNPLFDNLSLVIAEGDRVGIVAGNGNGKGNARSAEAPNRRS